MRNRFLVQTLHFWTKIFFPTKRKFSDNFRTVQNLGGGAIAAVPAPRTSSLVAERATVLLVRLYTKDDESQNGGSAETRNDLRGRRRATAKHHRPVTAYLSPSHSQRRRGPTSSQTSAGPTAATADGFDDVELHNYQPGDQPTSPEVSTRQMSHSPLDSSNMSLAQSLTYSLPFIDRFLFRQSRPDQSVTQFSFTQFSTCHLAVFI